MRSAPTAVRRRSCASSITTASAPICGHSAQSWKVKTWEEAPRTVRHKNKYQAGATDPRLNTRRRGRVWHTCRGDEAGAQFWTERSGLVTFRWNRRMFLTGAGLIGAGAAAGAVGGFTAEPALAAEGPTARTVTPAGPGAYAAKVTFRTAPPDRLVALTLDDGPTREWTPQVLEILRRHGAKATFFRVGERARAAPDLVVQTAEAGHEQGNHTWSHSDLT